MGVQLQLKVLKEKPKFIKAASPADHSRVYLHNIDQQVFFHSEILFIYDVKSGNETEGAVEKVDVALCKIIDQYHFLTGRFRINEQESRLELECNGKGVLFVGAYCDCSILELGEVRGNVVNPDMRKLLAYPEVQKIEDIPLLTVQVTRFKCGGVIVGMHVHHIALDGITGGDFFVNFARLAAGGSLEEHVTSLTPDRTCLRARNPPQVTFPHPEIVQLPDIPAILRFHPSTYDAQTPLGHTTKIFPFSAAQLDNLKKAALADGTVTRCSTFEALAAHLGRAKYLATASEENQQQLARLFIAMEVRHKLKKNPLPTNFCGNAVIAVSCLDDVTISEVCNNPLSFAVLRMQKAFAQVNEEFIHSQIDWCEKIGHGIINVPGSLIISPWSKLRFEEVDFGWGKPSYIMPMVNDRQEYVVIISNCKRDGGLDVFMGTHPDKMAKLEEYLNVLG